MTTTDAAHATATCCVCGRAQSARPAKAGGIRTPRRWKKVADGFRCPDCTKGGYLPRSIRLSIADIAPPETRTRQEMYTALVRASSDMARFANWYVQQLFAHDPALAWRHGEKFPALPEVDWYAPARARFGDIAPTGLTSAAQQIRAWYAADRYETFGCLKRSVRSYRWSELPVYVHRQSWRIAAIESDHIVVRLQIGPGPAWHIKCRANGENFARLKAVMAGEAEAGMAMFCRRRRAKRPGESTPPPHVWQLRVSALVPKPRRRDGNGVVALRHDPRLLLVATCGAELLEVPGQRLRERVVRHRLRDWREQQDNSEQHRLLSRRARKRLAARRTDRCGKNVRYVGKELELAASVVARWCVGQRAATVLYDATDRNWIDGFPYRALANRLRCALENAGIELKIISETQALAEPMGETEALA